MNITARHFPLWTALVTPFSDDGKLDREAFIGLLKRQEEAKNGILILGSTGEGLALSLEEKKEIVSLTCEQNLKVPIMVGVGGFALEECSTWINWCQKLAIHGFLLVTPLYSKPGPKGQVHWFESLLDTSTLPCMLYNVPGRAAVELHPEAFKKLAGHKNCWALKEASGDLSKFKNYLSLAGSVELFSGDDALTFQFCEHGGKGLVSVMSNVWPKETAKFVEFCKDGKKDLVMPVWEEVANSLFEVSNPIPTKVLLKELGVISSAKLRSPLVSEELASVKKQLEAHEKVQHWKKENINE